jgi:hypothetical protein
VDSLSTPSRNNTGSVDRVDADAAIATAKAVLAFMRC